VTADTTRTDIARARADLVARIASAAARAGRPAGDVSIVAVTKGVPPDHVRAALEAGLSTFGENRVQEASAKIPLVGGGRWHLIGPLQSNKARRAVELVDVIETVESVDLAARLDRLVGELRPGASMPILLQVNVDADPAKAGFDPGALAAALPRLVALPRLRIDGLMTVGRLVVRPDDARPTFRALRALSDRLRAVEPGLGGALSMGMSDDFEVAIEEGATIVRIGRALFGERPAVR
jgi:pyridoxal phosphate enzyme (YggS family)